MAKGGAREGSGRKPGVSKVTLLKRTIQDYISEKEVKDLIDTAKKQAKQKPELMRFLLEQIFGKAPQILEHTGEISISLFNTLNEMTNEPASEEHDKSVEKLTEGVHQGHLETDDSAG